MSTGVDPPGRRRVILIALVLFLIPCAVLRLVALDVDPPQWLSWSMGLQTDEGFYTLDARHQVLFGRDAPGNFHDRLVSPLLSVLQQAAFRTLGVGTVQARLLSVVFGLLTVVLFWHGLRLASDGPTAAWGALFLGLAPPVVFYNRMALQETPAAFWLVLAFALWAAAGHAGTESRRAGLLGLSSISMAVAIVFKPLAIIALPAFLAACWRGGLGAPEGGRSGSHRLRSLLLPTLGLGGTFVLYVFLWYVPHHVELARMAAYYRMHQFMPHTAQNVWLNIRRGLVDSDRGVLPYLLRLLPIPCLFVLAGHRHRSVTPGGILSWWLLGGLAFCLLSSYAPDRYYVLFYPALAGLAALGAARLPRPAQVVGLILFLGTSGYWYGRAWSGCVYARRDAARTLARSLPVGSILVGETAPALGLDTPFATAPVQPGLSNDERPVERLQATHVLVTRAADQQRWWRSHESAAVRPTHRLLTLPLRDRNGDVVDVYAVNEQRR